MKVIHLMNGSKEVRVKSSEGLDVYVCGCACTERKWVQMCEEHHREWRLRHEDETRRQYEDET